MHLILLEKSPYLNNWVVSLQRRDVFLNFDLSFRVVLDVVADFQGVVEIDVAHLGDVESLGDDGVETVGQCEEEKHWLDGYPWQDLVTLWLDLTHFLNKLNNNNNNNDDN